MDFLENITNGELQESFCVFIDKIKFEMALEYNEKVKEIIGRDVLEINKQLKTRIKERCLTPDEAMLLELNDLPVTEYMIKRNKI